MTSKQQLAGKVAIVTGAAGGIGRAAAACFAAHGAALCCVDIDGAGEGVAGGIVADGAEALFLQADVTLKSDCKSIAASAMDAYGRVDILFNNAGIVRRATVLETREAEWDRVMAVNVKSIYLLSREVIPIMQRQGGGSIINTASGWGLAAGPRAAVYCASKGAVVQLTKAMAIDHAAEGIRVNCVCPGDIDTAMLRAEADELGEAEAAFLDEAADRPLGRVGTPMEIAEAVLFLAGDTSTYVTGISLVVDGGGLLG